MSKIQSTIKNSKFNIYNLKSKIKNLSFLKSEFNRNVLTLTSGTAIAQAIPVLVKKIINSTATV